MNKSKNTPFYFEPARAGRLLKEVGVDFLKVEDQSITSRWFHSAQDVDLFVWLDEKERVIKQQVSFCGQIVEWNILDGIKTGFVIEEEIETEEKKLNASEVIRFDGSPQGDAIRLAVEVIQNIPAIEEPFRRYLLSNFGVPGMGNWKELVRLTRKGGLSELTTWDKIKAWFKKVG